MKTKFSDFIIETKNNISFNDFISEIKKLLISDFHNNELQSDEYISLYNDLFKKLYDENFEPKEAIAATKVPGFKLDNKSNESTTMTIDNDIDKLTNLVENIKSRMDLSISNKMIKKYFDKYSKEKYSDIRILERVKNNYIKLTKLYNIKYKQFNKK